jgi:hypothetical protein
MVFSKPIRFLELFSNMLLVGTGQEAKFGLGKTSQERYSILTKNSEFIEKQFFGFAHSSLHIKTTL